MASTKIGNYEIDDFIGFPVHYLDNHLSKNGFYCIQLFNDYKYKWICYELNTSILAHVYHQENDIDGSYEIIDTINIYKQ